MKRIYCTKCKASPPYVLLDEIHSGGGIQFEQTDAGIGMGYTFDPSSIDGVWANCSQCHHTWKLRNVSTIDDVKDSK